MARSTAKEYFKFYSRVLTRPKDSLETYSSADVVGEFRALDDLFPPEEVIYGRLKDELVGKSVLDVGVGAGRTSHAFGKSAGRYLGVDYSAGMIAACKERFSGVGDRFEFCVADAREIRLLGEPWDLIIFSFNGIDHLGLADRNRFFRDVRSMLQPSGSFWFSSHNIGSLPTIYKMRVENGAPLKERAYALFSWVMIRLANEPRRRLARKPHALINDGSLRFSLRVYYGSVEETVEQLRQAGFDSVTVLAMDGREIAEREYGSVADFWVTYLCSSSGSPIDV